MATHEIYVGGPPSRNIGLSMFPLPTFNEDAAGFQVGPAAHKGPIGYNLTRLLDFSGDNALAEFLRENTVAQGDTLGVQILPKEMILLGFFYEIITAKAGITLTPKFRGTALSFTAIDGSVAAKGFVLASGGAKITEGAASLAGAWYNNKPDMLDLTLTALPATGLAGFKMVVSPVMLSVNAGGYR